MALLAVLGIFATTFAAENDSVTNTGWRVEDSLAIVSLHPKAPTGPVDSVLEERLISAGT